jgi:hypothetical protein
MVVREHFWFSLLHINASNVEMFTWKKSDIMVVILLVHILLVAFFKSVYRKI